MSNRSSSPLQMDSMQISNNESMLLCTDFQPLPCTSSMHLPEDYLELATSLDPMNTTFSDLTLRPDLLDLKQTESTEWQIDLEPSEQYEHDNIPESRSQDDPTIHQSSDVQPHLENQNADDRSKVIQAFYEQGETEYLDLADPTPGYLSFPGTFDANDQRRSAREIFEQPQQDILPSTDEPLWKQMLDYCNRWAVWVTTVDDDKRRSELTDWVTTKMSDAWKFAIANGHCGEPNGHTECCLAHSKSRSSNAKEVRKRPVDAAKQPAPFACEGLKHPYSLTNKELEDAELTMDEILSHATPEKLEAGQKLLQRICDILDRPTLEMKDWTAARPGRFFPGTTARNLLMFGLFEAQRCYGIVAQCETHAARANTLPQQKALQRRKEVHQQRGDEHLAMAVVLDGKRGEESDTDVEVDDQETAEARVTRASNRDHTSTTVVEVFSSEEDGSDAESDTPELTSSASTKAASVTSSREDSPSTLSATLDDEHLQVEDLEATENNQNCKLDAVAEHSHREDYLTTEPSIGQKRGHNLVSAAAQAESKRPKYDNNVPFTNPPYQQNFLYGADTTSVGSMNHAAGNSGWQAQQMTGNIAQPYTQFRHNMDTGLGQDGLMTQAVETRLNTKQVEQIYIAQKWQPYVNQTLIKHGYPPLQWNLTCWAHIDQLLEQLGVSVDQRGQLHSFYSADLTQWTKVNAEASAQPRQPLILNPPKANTSRPGPSPHDELNSSKGFSFRYLPTTTKAERDHVDSMVVEYISFIMHAKTARYGYYVVFIMQGDPTQKPLAHGIWNMRGNREVEDAKWFYTNRPQPKSFRPYEQRLFHEWGYSIAPPKKQSKSKTSHTRAAFDDDEDVYARQPSGSERAHRSKTKPAQSSSHNGHKRRSHTPSTKRRIVRDDSGSDEDYRPGDY